MNREQQGVVLFLGLIMGLFFFLTPQESQWSFLAAPAAKNAVPGGQGQVLVEIDGGVNQRGVVSVESGSTLLDAVEKAGGVKGGLSLSPESLEKRIEKSSRLQVVPDGKGKAGVSVEPVAAPKLKVLSIPVSINSATLEELDTLPGIGPKTAQAIIEFREAYGKFTSPDGLLQVPGIGPKKLAALLPHIKTD
ncbi:MAG TPA: ComEA family DNA-binding protein [Thermodesulfobacteriota bacterium]|nr:ComEA family DNA-binding protein [Thermodesulfobacteriota bacterium]